MATLVAEPPYVVKLFSDCWSVRSVIEVCVDNLTAKKLGVERVWLIIITTTIVTLIEYQARHYSKQFIFII